MFLTGNHTFVRTILVIIAQILGAIAASAVVVGLLPGHGIVATTQLGGGISTVQGLFLEMFLTAELIFVIFMLASEKHLSTAVAPVGIGLALFICHLVYAHCPLVKFTVHTMLTSSFPGESTTPVPV